MGTGKTYIGEAFAGESGLTCIKFKNFRERWVGATEANFEKILQVVKALGYVLLIIDEADRSMGGGDSDGGTSSRVIARLKEFMSDTEHRGRIVIVMMTNRPDKIDVDLKRPGRLDYKIPFFFPQDVETRTAIMRALIRKNKILLMEDIDLEAVQEALIGFSAAELEAVLLRAIQLTTMGERERVSQEDLSQASEDVIPSRDVRMLEYMEMLAVFEASSRKMLPSKYRELTVDQIQQRLDQLRLQLGLRI
jgi:transitional endoplasmic reticulum ATPase